MTTPSDMNRLPSGAFSAPKLDNTVGIADSLFSDNDKGKSKNFKVVIRARPPIEREAGVDNCIEVRQNEMVVIRRPASAGKPKSHKFAFDRVYTHTASQEALYTSAVHPVVTSVLEGYNGSIIAYGQTGTGKTFTIEGGHGDARGIIPRASEEIFDYIENISDSSSQFLVRASFLQIYNEKISDLLTANKATDASLNVREDPNGDVIVDGLSEHVVKTPSDVRGLLELGTKMRTTSSTKMNLQSSRSHAIFKVIVEHSTLDPETQETNVTIGQLYLVDLAGSERVSKTGIQGGKQLDEMKNINTSLTAFGKVVLALTSPGSTHVPYRDSKLTRLLQGSLGGNCKTTLITAITPSGNSYTETLSSLKFAKRAKNVKNYALVNEDLGEQALLRSYQKEISKLRKALEKRSPEDDVEVNELRLQQRELTTQNLAFQSALQARAEEAAAAQEEASRLQSQIVEMEAKMLTGGTNLEQSPEFKAAVQRAEDRLKREYAAKLAQLEEERREVEREREELRKLREQLERAPAPTTMAPPRTNDSPLLTLPANEVHELDLTTGSMVLEEGLLEARRQIHASTPPSIHTSRPVTRSDSSCSTDPPVIAVSSFETSPMAPRPPSRDIQRVKSPVVRRAACAPAHRRTISPQQTTSKSVYESSSDSSDDEAEEPQAAEQFEQYTGALHHPQYGVEAADMQINGHLHRKVFSGATLATWLGERLGSSSMDLIQATSLRLLQAEIIASLDGNVVMFKPDATTFYKLNPIDSGGRAHNNRRMLRSTSAKSVVELLPAEAHDKPSLDRRPSATLRSKLARLSSLRLSSALKSRASSARSIGSRSRHDSDSSISTTMNVDEADLENGATLLHSAAGQGDRNGIKTLLQNFHVDVLDQLGRTPLMYACISNKSRAVELLLKAEANANLHDLNGRTSLLWAAYYGHVEVIRMLLRFDANLIGATDPDGRTAVHWACKQNSTKALDVLLKACPSSTLNAQDVDLVSALHWSVMCNHPEHIMKLMKAGCETQPFDREGRTPLHYAVSMGSQPCSEALLANDPAGINLQDSKGRSPLHLAISDINPAGIVDDLLGCHCVDVNCVDSRMTTPLHWAAVCNRPDICKLLVQHGADPSFRDVNGMTALHYATTKGYQQCAALLRQKAKESRKEEPMATRRRSMINAW
eukprot:TRINITY_DN11067_c0_g1_i3.p1 TRINITY_DN11067_c0_g1~~TRINITY_DN11067_c0_g1_i3.p1  ORF type:complete len:1163 (+),score=245.02 TRINITY_DN11067_c0_g1_i3:231-3719(+)